MKQLLNLCAVCVLLLGSIVIASADTWQMVTDASTLRAGDKLVLACTAREATAANISGQVMLTSDPSTFSGNTITTLANNAIILTLGGKAGNWTLANSQGKLLGATAVKDIAWDKGTTTWDISISATGDATIQNTTSSYGRFLYNVQSPRFTTYTSKTNTNMLLPQLYRLMLPQDYTFMYEGFAGNTTRCEGGLLCQKGDVIVLSSGTPTKQGYIFAGWQYQSKIYQPGDSFTMLDSDVVMVPVWNEDPTESATDITTISVKAHKVIRDGYLYIFVNDNTYDTMGRKITDNH